MNVTQENNFCRVFELPIEFPSGFCFGGGIPITFKMVDWFNPIPAPEMGIEKLDTWDEYKPLILEWLVDKVYLKPDRQYILITDFGKTIVFNTKGEL